MEPWGGRLGAAGVGFHGAEGEVGGFFESALDGVSDGAAPAVGEDGEALFDGGAEETGGLHGEGGIFEGIASGAEFGEVFRGEAGEDFRGGVVHGGGRVRC